MNKYSSKSSEFGLDLVLDKVFKKDFIETESKFARLASVVEKIEKSSKLMEEVGCVTTAEKLAGVVLNISDKIVKK